MNFDADSTEVDSGLALVGPIRWGTHICQFYDRSNDLEDMLAPYFRAGLESGETCLWIAGDAERARRGAEAVAAVFPGFEAARARGQIEIVEAGEWYVRNGIFEPDRVLDTWARRSDLAQRDGYAGLRAAGDPLWLQTPAQIAAFLDYEQRLDTWIAGRRMVCVCAYCASTTSAAEVMDVIRRHDMAVARRQGAWEPVEGGSLAAVRGRLQETTGELRRVTSALDEAKETARRRADTRSRMISAAGHDVRQPLHALALYLGLLDRHVASEQGRVILSKMELAVRTMTRTFSALIDLAKLEVGAVKPEMMAYPVADAFAGAAEQAGEAVPGAAGRVRVVTSRLGVRSDPDLLEIILRILLVNALEHASSGKVLLGCRRDREGVRIEVHDRGPGIPPERLRELFREFVRGETSAAQPGMGLGLAIAERLAKLLDHALTVRSAVGRGTVFAIRIPRADQADLAEPPQLPLGAPERPAVPLEGACILLVDDDPLALDASRRALEDAGATVTTARSVGGALADPAPFDACVLDLDLGEDSGLDLVNALEARAGGPVPAIFVTATTSASRLQALRASGRRWLAKPVTAAELARAVRGLLPQGRAEAQRATGWGRAD